MKTITILATCVLSTWTATAQSLQQAFGPLPQAVSKTAALPEELAKKMSLLNQEKQQKLLLYGSNIPVTENIILTEANTHLVLNNQTPEAIMPAAFPFYEPEVRLRNTSHGRERIENGQSTFNTKKDRLSHAVIENHHFTIISRTDKRCDMSEFLFTSETEGLHMEGNRYVLDNHPIDIALGKAPSAYPVRCTHTPSGLHHTFTLQFYFPDSIVRSGMNGSFAVMTLPRQEDTLAILYDWQTQYCTIVTLPFILDTEGLAGIDGRRGVNGINGTNAYSWKDSNGKSHYTAGTCAQAGGNGENGTDGTNGGNLLLCMDKSFYNQQGLQPFTILIDGGKGGKGGIAGTGGIHGAGSGCRGKAPDGKPGKNGRDGQRGDFLYVVTDLSAWYQQIMKGHTL